MADASRLLIYSFRRRLPFGKQNRFSMGVATRVGLSFIFAFK